MDTSTILITGAGRRLGLFLARHYLSLGWRVIAHYNTGNEMPESEQQRYIQESRYMAFHADLTSSISVTAIISKIQQLNWGIDAVIHNASYFIADNPNASLSERWQLQQDMASVHILAVDALTNELITHFRDGASIIALTDVYADKPNQRFASYCAAKSGLQNLCLSYAQRFAPKIRVNAIQPGPIQFLPEHSDQYQKKVLSQSLLKRELGYDSILQGIEYLLAAKSVTGSILKIDGGRSSANHYEQFFTDS